MTEEYPPPQIVSSPQIDTSVSHSARVWDYWLGGKDNYPVDREVGDRIAGMLPEIVRHARANRMFLGRAVRFLAGEAGIRQFLDIGSGLPTVDNTHEVAQRVATAYLHADLREPGDLLAGAAKTLDLTEPVAIMILGVLWHILDDAEVRAILGRLMGAVAPGSYLVIAHPTLEVTGEKMARAIAYWNEYGTPHGRSRTPAELAAMLDGLELVEPGVVSSTLWRPEAAPFGEPEPIDQFCAHHSGDVPEGEVGRRVELGMRRQRVLHGPASARLWAVIDEAALRRQVSGRAVMREQLRHLIGACEMPMVTIQVLPFSAGGPPAAIGGLLALLRLPDREVPDIGYLEQLARGRCFHAGEYVDYFRNVLDRLAVQAATTDSSQHILTAILAET